MHSHCKDCFQILASSCKHQTDLSEGTPLCWFHNILTDLMTKLQPWNGASTVWCFMGARHKVSSSTVLVSPFETWTCFELIWTREGSKTCNVQWNFPHYKNTNIVIFVSAVSLEMNKANKVCSLEMKSSHTHWYQILHWLESQGWNKEENCKFLWNTK